MCGVLLTSWEILYVWSSESALAPGKSVYDHHQHPSIMIASLVRIPLPPLGVVGLTSCRWAKETLVEMDLRMPWLLKQV
jgi:hypothetical protein